MQPRLGYDVPGNEYILTEQRHGVVVPEVEHSVRAIGPVCFRVDFARREKLPSV